MLLFLQKTAYASFLLKFNLCRLSRYFSYLFCQSISFWAGARDLNRARVGYTYLQYSKIQGLVTTLKGQGQNFDRLYLEGINLKCADLQDTSFINTNLNNADLQKSDLSRAILKQTQLDGANLTGAIITGAYIEDWGITGETDLNNIRCEYVYMHVPTKMNPNPIRKPDNLQEIFTDGDFADFIKPLVNTLDLYHNQHVDPRAIAVSFKQLAESHPEAKLEIVAMERRGRNKFLLKALTASGTNHSELSAEYFSTYNQIKVLVNEELQTLLNEKDNRISRLENMIVTALQRPSFYAETYQNQGVIMSERKTESGDVSISGGNFAAVGSLTGDNSATVSGIQNIYHSEQQKTLAEVAFEIQQLLEQLQQTNPTATDAEKDAYVNDKTAPSFKSRVISALQVGGETAIEEFLDNSYVNVGKALIKGWLEAR